MEVTKRLYFSDSYLKSFTSKVVVVESDPKVSSFKIKLAETAFYPSSGGQPNDVGFLRGPNDQKYAVIDVVEEKHDIWHVLDAKPESEIGLSVGDSVEGEIDWPRRFRNIQQHSGQHLLSALLTRMFGLQTVSVHLGASSTIDVEGALGSSEKEIEKNLEELEVEFNRVVFQGVKMWVENKEDGGTVTRESTNPSSPTGSSDDRKEACLPYRVIHIDGIDANGCCGTHASHTGEIGPVLMLGCQRNKKTQTRITYVLGSDCTNYMRRQRDTIKALDRTVDARMEDLPHVVQNIVDSRKAMKKELEQLQKLCGDQFLRLAYLEKSREVAISEDLRFKVILLDKSPMEPYEENLGYRISSLFPKDVIYIGRSVAKNQAAPHRVFIAVNDDRFSAVNALKTFETVTAVGRCSNLLATGIQKTDGLPTADALLEAVLASWTTPK